jgi:hypothetical protein
MSAMTTSSVPLRSPAAKAAPKRPLRLVSPRRSSAAKAPFVVVVVTLLVSGLLGLLLLNTLVAQDSFALHDLSTQGRVLDQREQDLAKQVQALQAPATLAARATSLGMVSGGPPAFLALPTGKVLGQPTAGVAPPVASTTWTAPKKPSPPATTRSVKPGVTAPTGAHR